MNKYLVIYRQPAASRQAMGAPSPEQSKAMMDAWMGWAKRTGPALGEMGAPLGATGSVGGTPATDAGGYSIVQAENMESAKAFFVGHPHQMMPGGTIDLFECVNLSM